MDKLYLNYKDVAAMLGISRKLAYDVIHKANEAAAKQGLYVIQRNKVSKKFLLTFLGEA